MLSLRTTTLLLALVAVASSLANATANASPDEAMVIRNHKNMRVRRNTVNSIVSDHGNALKRKRQMQSAQELTARQLDDIKGGEILSSNSTDASSTASSSLSATQTSTGNSSSASTPSSSSTSIIGTTNVTSTSLTPSATAAANATVNGLAVDNDDDTSTSSSSSSSSKKTKTHTKKHTKTSTAASATSTAKSCKNKTTKSKTKTKTSTKDAATTSSTSAPTASSTSSSSSGTGLLSGASDITENGQITWFEVGLGACGYTDSDSDYIAALPVGLWDSIGGANVWEGNIVCNKKIMISNGKKAITVTVRDQCPTCANNHLDLSPSAFEALATLDDGEISVSWGWVGGEP